jgi:hypothetical protein
MTLRRVLLVFMLVALAGCAAIGMMALFVSSNEGVWRLLGTAFSTAVAAGLLMPATLLVDRPRVRLGGLMGMLVVGACWFLINVAMWGDAFHLGSMDWRAFCLFWQVLAVGVPVTAALLLVSFKWARVAVWTLTVLATLALGFYTIGTVLPASSGSFFGTHDLTDEFWAMGGALESLGLVASLLLVNLGQGDRRYFRWPGVLLCVAAFVIAVMGIWGGAKDEFYGRLFGVMAIAAVGFAHTNVVLMARLKPGQGWLVWGTIAFIAAAALAAAGAVLTAEAFDAESTALLRLSAAACIAAMCGSLALIVLSLFNRNVAPAPVVSQQFTDITLFCPSCSTKQKMAIGGGTCTTCSLQITVTVTEPRCAGCGYLLYNIASDRCPECGAATPRVAALAPKAPPAVAISPAVTATPAAGSPAV